MSKHKIDTRTASPYQVGSDLVEFAGGFDIEDYDSKQEAADDVAQVLDAHGLTLVDYDGEVLDMASYVIQYLE